MLTQGERGTADAHHGKKKRITGRRGACCEVIVRRKESRMGKSGGTEKWIIYLRASTIPRPYLQ